MRRRHLVTACSISCLLLALQPSVADVDDDHHHDGHDADTLPKPGGLNQFEKRNNPRGKLAHTIGGLIEAFKKRNSSSDDLLPTGRCKEDLNKLCADVTLGDARGANCLQEASRTALARRERSPLSVACRHEVSGFFLFVRRYKSPPGSAKKIPVDIVPGLREACEHDIGKYCSNTPVDDPMHSAGDDVLQCLKETSRKGPGNLQKRCNDKLFQIRKREAHNLLLDKPFFKDCNADILQISECKDAPLHALRESGEMKSCLRKHRDELTSQCKARLFTREKHDAEDLRLDPETHNACAKEITDFCKDVEFGRARMLKCLTSKMHSTGFGSRCHSKIMGKTKKMLTDYRLDFRLRNSCEKDIGTLCRDEVEAKRQDPDGSDETLTGIVAQCLKEKYSQIESDECKSEVRRVVRMHARIPSMNPVHARKCEGDIQRFCMSGHAKHMHGQAKELNVHHCLRQHLAELDEECRDMELVQGSLEARDITMKPSMKIACEGAISIHCKDIPPVDGQVIQCLQEHYLDMHGFPSTCAEIVKEDLAASQHDLRLKYGASDACKADSENLCGGKLLLGGTALISCLKRNMKDIKSRQCIAEMQRYVAAGVLNIAAAPLTNAACLDDVSFFCSEVKPGQGRVHQCLVENRAELSPGCAVKEFEQEALKAKDIRMSPLAMQACGGFMKDQCSGMNMGDGSMWRCLEDKRDTISIPSKCRHIISSHIMLKNTEFYLNPLLAKSCKEDAAVLCSDELEKAERQDFSSQGSVIACLVAKRQQVRNGVCQTDILRKQMQRVADIRNDPDAYGACKEDIAQFCPGVKSEGVGGVHKCLQKHMDDLSESCKSTEISLMIMKTRDVRLNPGMMRNCKVERQSYCKDLLPGSGRIIDCLIKHMHKMDFGGPCRTRMEDEQALRATSIVFIPSLLRACRKDYDKLVERSKCPKVKIVFNSPDPQIPESFAHVRPSIAGMRGFGSQGRVIKCLTQQRHELKNVTCQSAVRQQLKRQSDDMRAMPGMDNFCRGDIKELCDGIAPGNGRVNLCLRMHKGHIKNSNCARAVVEVEDAEKEDIIINPQMAKSCRSEVKSFCQEVEHWELASCLFEAEKEEGFSDHCKGALAAAQVSKWMGTIKKRRKKMKDPSEIMDWLQKNVRFQQEGVATGAVAGSLVTLALGSVIYFVFQRRQKFGYAVVSKAVSKD